MKFTKEKRDDLLHPGRVVVSFVAEGEEVSTHFVICASVGGISFVGESPAFSTAEDMDLLAKTIGAASVEHVKMKRAIRSKLI